MIRVPHQRAKQNVPFSTVMTADSADPIHTTSIDGETYFMNFTDGWARLMFVLPITTLGDLPNFIISALTYTIHAHEKSHALTNPDNSKHYLSKAPIESERKILTIPRTQIPFNPEKSGFFDRSNHTIIDGACCALTRSKIAEADWPLAEINIAFKHDLIYHYTEVEVPFNM